MVIGVRKDLPIERILRGAILAGGGRGYLVVVSIMGRMGVRMIMV